MGRNLLVPIQYIRKEVRKGVKIEIRLGNVGNDWDMASDLLRDLYSCGLDVAINSEAAEETITVVLSKATEVDRFVASLKAVLSVPSGQ